MAVEGPESSAENNVKKRAQESDCENAVRHASGSGEQKKEGGFAGEPAFSVVGIGIKRRASRFRTRS